MHVPLYNFDTIRPTVNAILNKIKTETNAIQASR